MAVQQTIQRLYVIDSFCSLKPMSIVAADRENRLPDEKTPIIPYQFSQTTARLLLRPLNMNDHPIWKETQINLPQSNNPWAIQPTPKENLTRKHFRQLLEAKRLDWGLDRSYYFAAFEQSTHQWIGQISLMDISRAIFQNAYIGYTIHTPYWRRGYGTEMLNAALKIAFSTLKLHRVEAGISPKNIPSIRLVEKVGFRFEGLSRKRLFFDGQWCDMNIYALTSEEV